MAGGLQQPPMPEEKDCAPRRYEAPPREPWDATGSRSSAGCGCRTGLVPSRSNAVCGGWGASRERRQAAGLSLRQFAKNSRRFRIVHIAARERQISASVAYADIRYVAPWVMLTSSCAPWFFRSTIPQARPRRARARPAPVSRSNVRVFWAAALADCNAAMDVSTPVFRTPRAAEARA